ncbi:MAG: metallophosphoesterase [Bacilli bacterium]
MKLSKKILLVPLLLSTTLTSCSGANKAYAVADYRKTLVYHDNFKIVQLTDLHYGVSTDFDEANAYVTKEIKESSPDLIVITGDTFMNSNAKIVNKVVSFLDSFDVPFALTYGNHDFQGDYSSDYIGEVLTKTKNAVFVDYADDDIYGKTNYFIDLVNGEETKYRLYIIDSNSYWQSGLFVGYDIIHEDQIKHLEKIAEEYGKVPSLAFFHIPLFEFTDANNLYKEGKIEGTGTNEEKCSVGYQKSDAFLRMKNIGVKGMFIGHDHINDTTLLYEDVILSYGMKSTAEIYHDKIGYASINLTSSSLSLNDIEKVVLK